MKKVGEIEFEHVTIVKEDDEEYRNSYDFTKSLWGSCYTGDDGKVWGIVFFKLKKTRYERFSEFVRKYNKDTKEDGTKYYFKTKWKSFRGVRSKKIYIPRPEEKMDDVLEYLDGYEWEAENEIEEKKVSIETDTPFKVVKKHELIKEL